MEDVTNLQHHSISGPNKKMETDCFDWLDFARAVYTCQKLETAIKQYSSPKLLKYIKLISSDTDLFKGTKFAYDPSEESDDSLDQVLGLVVEASDRKRNEESDKKSLGDSVLVYLNKLLYPKPYRQEDFLSSVRNGSVSRALISARICESLLIDSVSTSNCFSLLNMAIQSGCQQLAHVCIECCLALFNTALDQDMDGFIDLSVEIVQFILGHDLLNVQREGDVVEAISMWIEHDMVNRMDKFVELFAACVRFSEIDYTSLANLVDSCDLIDMNQQAIELAAHELIQKTMGTSRENALGLGTICRPRNPRQTSQCDDSHVHRLTHLIESMINHECTLSDRFLGKENVQKAFPCIFADTEILVSPTKMENILLPNKTLHNHNGSSRSLSQLLLH